MTGAMCYVLVSRVLVCCNEGDGRNDRLRISIAVLA